MPKKHSLWSQKTTRRGFIKRSAGFLASHWLLASFSLGGAGVYTWAKHDTLDLRLEIYDLFYPNLPSALEGKVIAQLSDLHLETLQLAPHILQEAVLSHKPDLIVITGDLISTRTDLDKMANYLSLLDAPFGKYIVMGNNDYSHFSHTLFKTFSQKLERLHWIPLINSAEFVSPLNLWIIGIDDPATAHDDVDKAYAEVMANPNQDTPFFRLTLAHSTDCLDDVSYYGSDLLLTGHTHGGQIRLPGLKPFITNTYLGDKGIYEGYHVIQNVPLYINRGIGESMLPLRLNVPPEIAFFILHKGSSAPKHRTLNK